MVVAVGKGVDRAHGKSEIRPKVRKPLTLDLLTAGMKSACELGTKGCVVVTAWPPLGRLSARSYLDSQLLSFVERVLMGISSSPRS